MPNTGFLIGTSNADGRLDVSPEAARPASSRCRRPSTRHPDLGNNRLDSIRNIIEPRPIGCCSWSTGLGETLHQRRRRITDPAILDLFADEVRHPATAIGVTFEQGFLHCAKVAAVGCGSPRPGRARRSAIRRPDAPRPRWPRRRMFEQVTEMLEGLPLGLAADSPEG